MPPKAPKQKPAKPTKPKSSSTLPPNWPPNLPYLTRPLFTPSLSRATPLSASLSLHTPCPASTPSPLVRIKPITTPSHPASGQHGLFATRTLPARSWILDYLGLYHLFSESDESSDYDISLDRESGVAVDAARAGNEGRFVNDYRGVPGATGANVVFENRRVGGTRGQLRIGIWVGAREIRKGEELLVSYGKGFWEGRRGEEGGVSGECCGTSIGNAVYA